MELMMAVIVIFWFLFYIIIAKQTPTHDRL